MKRKQSGHVDRDADCQWPDDGSCLCLLTSLPVWLHFLGSLQKGCVTLCLLYQSNISCHDLWGPRPYRTRLTLFSSPSAPQPCLFVCEPSWPHVSIHDFMTACLMILVRSDQPGPPQSLVRPSSSNIFLDSLSLLSPPPPSLRSALRLNEEANLPWILNGDLCVLWCEHRSGSHYAPIRTDHGFREAILHLLCSLLLFLALMQTMPESLEC